LKPTKFTICCGGGVLGTAAGFIFIGSLATMFFAAIFGTLCTDYKCEGNQCAFGSFSPCADANVCCNGCTAMCKSTNEWACDLGSKKTIAMLFGFIGFIVTLIAGCCSCAAGCCCPDKFNEMATGQAGGGAPTVVGQPA
jgi:hypothetical protein